MTHLRRLCLIGLCGLLAACSAAMERLELIDPEDVVPLGIPRPFMTPAGAEPLAGSILRGASVHVARIDGLPAPMDGDLMAAVIAAAHNQEIAATGRAAAASAEVLHGTARLGDSQAAIDWTLSGPDGVRRDSFTVSAPLPAGARGIEVFADRATAATLATATADRLRHLIDAMQGRSGRDFYTERGAPRILVTGVDGAPGDGNRMLGQALKGLLAQYGMRMVDAADGAPDYRVRGRVKLSRIDSGTEEVELVWEVVDGEGAEVGSVSQSNVVRAGALNQAWGDNAYFAALGAAEGILQAIEQAEARRAPREAGGGR